MLLLALVAGFGLGFVGSVPVAGPTAVVVVESALDNRPRDAFWVAVGAAIAESLYALVAFWGIATLFARYPAILPVSRVAGGAVLVVVGVYFLVRGSRSTRGHDQAGKKRGRLLFGFSITALNPTLAATWTTAVAALHGALSSVPFTALDALPFAGGAGVGIVGWFWLLVRIVKRVRTNLKPETMTQLVRVLGASIAVLGVLLASRTLFERH